jgi:hypothetical protein
MEALNVELRFAFQFHEAHCWARCSLGNRFGISIVILVRLDVGADVLRRHEADAVALLLKQAAKMMRATASLHGDDARWQSCRELGHAATLQPPPQDDVACAVQADDAAAVLAKIYTEHCDLHDGNSSPLKWTRAA